MVWAALILSIGVFLGLHAAPFLPRWRQRWLAALGAGRYRLAFAVLSLASLVAAFVLAGQAPAVVLWPGHEALRWLAVAATLPAFVLIASAYLGREGWRLARHPMLAGFGLWSGAHLLATGTLAYVLLFGAVAGYSVLAMRWSDQRLAASDPAAWAQAQATTSLVPFVGLVRGAGVGRLWLGAPTIGFTGWAVLLLAHPWLFGVDALPN